MPGVFAPRHSARPTRWAREDCRPTGIVPWTGERNVSRFSRRSGNRFVAPQRRDLRFGLFGEGADWTRGLSPWKKWIFGDDVMVINDASYDNADFSGDGFVIFG